MVRVWYELEVAIDSYYFLLFIYFITHVDYISRRGYDFRVRLFVCPSVCLLVRGITQKRKIPKRSNLVQGMTSG